MLFSSSVGFVQRNVICPLTEVSALTKLGVAGAIVSADINVSITVNL